ncbi:MAG: 5-formyltetrahydrofolate cyclo-ligase [Rhizobiales bacterium]|nr:5-formyltetrahydrofolate cyclo-ligase [Hyphomicrobiales bacterium]
MSSEITLSERPSARPAPIESVAGAEAKARLRAIVMARRSAAALAHGDSAGNALRREGLRLLEAAPTGPISAFWPSRNEIDVVPLITALAEAGREICLPVMQGSREPLLFRSWRPGDRLVDGPFRIPQPAGDRPVLEPAVMLVPLVAFDAEGYRIGYGGGYYDRTLARAHARGAAGLVTIAVAFDEQELVRVPREAHDQRLDWILTPRGARLTRA